MRTDFEKIREVNKAILEDKEIEFLIKQKQKLLNSLTPKYLWNKETNTMTAIMDEESIKKLDQIALLVEQRTEQIKRHYA
jgi:hypothetical protein